MRRQVLLLWSIVGFLTIGIAPATTAWTGCPPTWKDYRGAVTSLFVAESQGPISRDSVRLAVGPVLTGTSPATVTFLTIAADPPMPQRSRWIVTTWPSDKGLAVDPSVVNGQWDPIQPIGSDGRIDWGRIVGAPPTVAALLLSFGLPSTDLSGEPVRVDQAPILGFKAQVALLSGFVVVWWKRRLSGRPARARRYYAGHASAAATHSGGTILGVGPGGSTPLAPTIYEYSHFPWQRFGKAVSDSVRAEADSRLPHSQDVDPVEEGAGQNLAALAALGLSPSLR